MSLGQWHQVAVSYDANIGVATLSVDGNINSANIGLLAEGLGSGPVLMGSRYYHTREHPEQNYFKGMVACMRLWRIARDLSDMRMETPLCMID